MDSSRGSLQCEDGMLVGTVVCNALLPVPVLWLGLGCVAALLPAACALLPSFAITSVVRVRTTVQVSRYC